MKLRLRYKELRTLEYEVDLLDGYDWEDKTEKERHELIVMLKDGGVDGDEEPTMDDMSSELVDWDLIK